MAEPTPPTDSNTGSEPTPPTDSGPDEIDSNTGSRAAPPSGVVTSRPWLTLLRLPADQRTVGAVALVAVPLVWMGLKWRGYRAVQRRLERLPAPGAAARLSPETVGFLVNRAARPWHALCLTRSLVGWWLLRDHAEPADLQVGVRRGNDGLDFHAWLVAGGRVVNDRADVGERYARFDGEIVPGSGFA